MELPLILIITLVVFDVVSFVWGFDSRMVLTLPSRSFANVGQHPTKEIAFELMIGFGSFRCSQDSETNPFIRSFDNDRENQECGRKP